MTTSLSDIEAELAYGSAFADPETIGRALADLCRFVGDLVGLPDGIGDAALFDPLTRMTLAAGLSAYRGGSLRGAVDFEPVLDALRAEPEGAGPLVGRMSATVGPARLACWSPPVPLPRLCGAFAEFFEAQAAENGLARSLRLVAPDATVLATLDDAVALLMRAVPRLSSSTLAHCRLLAVVEPTEHARDGVFESASFDEVPGVVFLSRLALGSVDQAAEAILHEAAHQKLTDLRLTRDILRPGYDHAQAATIPAPWTNARSWNSAEWDVDRALAACHVYVHLAVLHRALDPDRTRARTATVLERASYLADRLAERGGDDLGRSGHQLVQLLRHIVQLVVRLDDSGEGAVGDNRRVAAGASITVEEG